MFSVKFLHQKLPNNVPILAGVSFGFLNHPLYFEVTSDVIENPLTLKFIRTASADKKAFSINLSKIENNEREIRFNLPGKGSEGGLLTPLVIGNTKTGIIAFMFNVESFPNADSFKLTYEFYEGIIQDEKKEDLK